MAPCFIIHFPLVVVTCWTNIILDPLYARSYLNGYVVHIKTIVKKRQLEYGTQIVNTILTPGHLHILVN